MNSIKIKIFLENVCFILFQYMSEKIGGVKGIELDEEFVEMERVSCFIGFLVYILIYIMLYYLFIIKVLKI